MKRLVLLLVCCMACIQIGAQETSAQETSAQETSPMETDTFPIIKDYPSDGETREFALAGYLEIYGSLSLLSLHAEAGIDNPFDSTIIQSIRGSVGFCIPFLLASFIPIRAKVLIGEEHSLELGIGVLYQYYPATDNELIYHWSDTPFTPNYLVGYRYEPYDHGLLFRVALEAAIDPPTKHWAASIGLSFGYRF